MSDLFFKPDFNLSTYMHKKNDLIAQDHPESAADCQTQNTRIADLSERFNNADPMKQLAMLGVKGTKTAKVLTEAEDKAATKRKHAESDLQLKFGNWVKKWFPNDRFVTHKREGQRSGFNRAVFNSFNNSEGHPDWEALIACEGFTGLLIEFKKPGEDWLLKDGVTVKTAYAHQYRCHVDLWKLGKAVYFCNDYDKARGIYKAYKEGKPLPQQLYKLK